MAILDVTGVPVEFFDERFRRLEDIVLAVEKRSDQRMDDASDNVSRAREGMEKRLDAMNEFRDTLKDQAGRFVTREEMAAKMDRMGSDIDTLLASMNKLSGKAEQSTVSIALGVAALSFLVSVAGMVLGFFGR